MWVQLSTTCSNFTEVVQWGAPSCSQPQPAMDNGIRDGRSNWLVAPPTLHRAVPPELHVLHTAMQPGLRITRLATLSQPRTCNLRSARPMHCLCGHSGLTWQWDMSKHKISLFIITKILHYDLLILHVYKSFIFKIHWLL